MTSPMEHHEDAFERAVTKANEWLRDFGEELGQTHAHLCYRGLRASLHALRDELPASEAAALAAQLPLLVRGLFYEGWSPARVPLRTRSSDELLAAVARELADGVAAPPRDVLRAGLATLERHVDRREIAHVRQLLPHSVRALWSDVRPRASEEPAAPPASGKGPQT